MSLPVQHHTYREKRLSRQRGSWGDVKLLNRLEKKNTNKFAFFFGNGALSSNQLSIFVKVLSLCSHVIKTELNEVDAESFSFFFASSPLLEKWLAREALIFFFAFV